MDEIKNKKGKRKEVIMVTNADNKSFTVTDLVKKANSLGDLYFSAKNGTDQSFLEELRETELKHLEILGTVSELRKATIHLYNDLREKIISYKQVEKNVNQLFEELIFACQ